MIHPTAVIDPTAKLASEVEVGAFAVIEENVKIGSGTVIRPHAIIGRNTTLGKGNYVESFASIGSDPQDLKFKRGTNSYLEIGDNNTFREGVTISRATGDGEKTIVGNHTLWMANTHAGHNCIIHDHVILVNGSAVAGHCTIGKGAILPANGAVHQFCWVGENAMFQGGSFVSMHVPPYVISAGINNVIGLNAVGMRRRTDLTGEDRQQIKEAFKITYRSGYTPKEALKVMVQFDHWGQAATLFRDFLQQVTEAEAPYNRGLAPHLSRSEQRRGSSL